MAEFAEVFENSKLYKDLAEKRSVFYEEVERALALVKEFIVKKKRILYGGMAIDLSLKLSGHEGIYKEGAIPDYDFMSPEFYEDSLELALILHEAGFKGISAINATHITSRRVRVHFQPVADITYIPENIYSRVPTLEVNLPGFEGLRVVHPDFQRLDMHRAFCTPFEKPPQEVIVQRMRKDQKRFKLLAERYPLLVEPLGISEGSGREMRVKKELLQNVVLGGYPAYALLYEFWLRLPEEFRRGREVLPLRAEVEKGELVFHWPFPEKKAPPGRVTLITDHWENLLPELKKELGGKEKEVYRNKFLDDLRPRTVLLGSWEVFDNYGRKLPVYNLMKLVHHWQAKGGRDEKTQNIWLAQAQYQLLYLLLKSIEEPEWREFHLSFYNSLVEMIASAEEAWLSEPGDQEFWPWLLSARVYGSRNWSPEYFYAVQERLHLISGVPSTTRGERPPFGFYPEQGTGKGEEFNPALSELFQIDGLERVTPFQPWRFQKN